MVRSPGVEPGCPWAPRLERGASTSFARSALSSDEPRERASAVPQLHEQHKPRRLRRPASSPSLLCSGPPGRSTDKRGAFAPALRGRTQRTVPVAGESCRHAGCVPVRGPACTHPAMSWSPEKGSNLRPMPYQDTALPLSYPARVVVLVSNEVVPPGRVELPWPLRPLASEASVSSSSTTGAMRKPGTSRRFRGCAPAPARRRRWQRRQGSNLRMSGSKPGALPAWLLPSGSCEKVVRRQGLEP